MFFKGKVKGAGIEVGRFLINSAVGYAGFLDLAKEVDLVTPEEDFGQTLGSYGVKPGPYLVLPFLQPFTVRDFTGYVADIFLNPINWLVAPIIEVEGVPSLIAHKNRTTTTILSNSESVSARSSTNGPGTCKNSRASKKRRSISTPPSRNAYLQSRDARDSGIIPVGLTARSKSRLIPGPPWRRQPRPARVVRGYGRLTSVRGSWLGLPVRPDS